MEKYKSSCSGSWPSGCLGSINGPRINGSPLEGKGEERQILLRDGYDLSNGSGVIGKGDISLNTPLLTYPL